jgi:YggT family protein
MVGDILSFLLFLYFLVLLGRLVFDWVQVFSRDWRPKGVLLVVAEFVYSLTDPPLNALRKVIPPLRLGGVALDLGFLVLIFSVSIASNLADGLPF